MYDVFEALCKKRNVTPYKVAKDTGLSTASLSNWKKGRYSPKTDKLKILADYFGVSVEYLATGKEPERGKAYYFDDETARIAQELMTTPGLRVLFDASRGSKPEDIQMVAELLERLKNEQ